MTGFPFESTTAKEHVAANPIPATLLLYPPSSQAFYSSEKGGEGNIRKIDFVVSKFVCKSPDLKSCEMN